jgi:hypothetical protein
MALSLSAILPTPAPAVQHFLSYLPIVRPALVQPKPSAVRPAGRKRDAKPSASRAPETEGTTPGPREPSSCSCSSRKSSWAARSASASTSTRQTPRCSSPRTSPRPLPRTSSPRPLEQAFAGFQKGLDAVINAQLKGFQDAQSQARRRSVPAIFGPTGEGDLLEPRHPANRRFSA